jgi:hypothetical protein
VFLIFVLLLLYFFLLNLISLFSLCITKVGMAVHMNVVTKSNTNNIVINAKDTYPDIDETVCYGYNYKNNNDNNNNNNNMNNTNTSSTSSTVGDDGGSGGSKPNMINQKPTPPPVPEQQQVTPLRPPVRSPVAQPLPTTPTKNNNNTSSTNSTVGNDGGGGGSGGSKPNMINQRPTPPPVPQQQQVTPLRRPVRSPVVQPLPTTPTKNNSNTSSTNSTVGNDGGSGGSKPNINQKPTPLPVPQQQQGTPLRPPVRAPVVPPLPATPTKNNNNTSNTNTTTATTPKNNNTNDDDDRLCFLMNKKKMLCQTATGTKGRWVRETGPACKERCVTNPKYRATGKWKCGRCPMPRPPPTATAPVCPITNRNRCVDISGLDGIMINTNKVSTTVNTTTANGVCRQLCANGVTLQTNIKKKGWNCGPC